MKKTNKAAKSKDARELLALNLRLLRVRNDITQEQLAMEAGINASYISQIESASRAVSIDILDKLARALKIPVATLLVDG